MAKMVGSPAVTVETASTMKCPHMTYCVNDYQVNADGIAPIVDNCNCISYQCMAWRWYDECNKFEDCNSCYRLQQAVGACIRRGYCGLAGDKIVE